MWRWLATLFGWDERPAARPATQAVQRTDPPPRGRTPPSPETPPAPASPQWIAFVDVETTGLSEADRVVSLGAILLDLGRVPEGVFDLRVLHLIFDPGRKSHPRAERAHGYDDWILRHQDLFADHAETVRGLIESADLVVAHNAAFDLAFIDREMAAAGLPPISRPVHCTMRAWQGRMLGGHSLAAACRTIGLSRSGEAHGALEDAYLAMGLHLWMNGHGGVLPFADLGDTGPTNLREVPSRPDGPLPRRKRRKPA